MNAPVAAIPTLDDLVQAAIGHGAIANIVGTEHPTNVSDGYYAALAVRQAIEDWAWETGLPEETIPQPLMYAAIVGVLHKAWDAREAADQLSFEFDRPVTDGAARYEARGE